MWPNDSMQLTALRDAADAERYIATINNCYVYVTNG